ncbi:MAG TPA: hypothetical protein EYP07_04710 [Kiloniellaceae bacterium]|nr:hypothetical protein [Kiloniellaceae bacterium]
MTDVSRPSRLARRRGPFSLRTLVLAGGLLAAGSLGTGITAAPAQAEVERWTVVCGESACLADYQAAGLQILIAPERGTRRLRAILRVSHKAGPDAPIALRLDSGWTAHLRTTACNHLFCQAAVGLEATDEVLARFRKDFEGMAAYRVGDQTVVARFSLKGFSNALNQLQ